MIREKCIYVNSSNSLFTYVITHVKYLHCQCVNNVRLTFILYVRTFGVCCFHFDFVEIPMLFIIWKAFVAIMIRDFNWEAWLFRPTQKLPNCTIFHSYNRTCAITSPLALFLPVDVLNLGFEAIITPSLIEINYQHIFRLKCLSLARSQEAILWRLNFSLDAIFCATRVLSLYLWTYIITATKGIKKNYFTFSFFPTKRLFNEILNWFLIENEINADLFIIETINWNLSFKNRFLRGFLSWIIPY